MCWKKTCEETSHFYTFTSSYFKVAFTFNALPSAVSSALKKKRVRKERYKKNNIEKDQRGFRWRAEEWESSFGGGGESAFPVELVHGLRAARDTRSHVTPSCRGGAACSTLDSASVSTHKQDYWHTNFLFEKLQWWIAVKTKPFPRTHFSAIILCAQVVPELMDRGRDGEINAWADGGSDRLMDG